MTAVAGVPADSGALFRRILLGLGGLIVAGTAVELAMERHWGTAVRLIPWVALGVITVTLLLVALSPGPWAIKLARVLAVVVIGSAAFGTWEHIRANYDAAPLDYRYSEKWATMSETSKWWKAATKGVGPSPILASGVLAQAALCTLAATVRHPALAKVEGKKA